jgi:hypothetical protein
MQNHWINALIDWRTPESHTVCVCVCVCVRARMHVYISQEAE